MFFAIGFGLGLGSLAGLSVGPYIFGPLTKPKEYKHILSEEADDKDEVLAPEHGTPVTAEMRSLLEFTEPWTMWPDYERVSMINRILAVMWPTITKAVMTEVLKQVKPQLEAQVFKKFAFIEDIVLGTQSMKDEAGFQAWIKDKDFSIGTVPPRVGGIKSYSTSDDEVVLEVPLVWGSNCKFDVGVFLRAGPVRLFVPVEVSNLQFKIETRITIKPLVEEVPCVGGANLTLLKAPHVDLSLKIIKGVDLMALPIIKDGLRFGIQHVLNGMLIYPNSMSFPIMANFGIPPPPKGALNVKLLRGENLKEDDTYVKMEVRKGRAMFSKTVRKNKNPEWGQEFNLIVDDYQQQTLKLEVFNDDFGWNDSKFAVGEVNFGQVVNSQQDPDTGKFIDEFELAEFIKAPMKEQMVAVKLLKPPPEGTGFLGSARSLTRLGTTAAKGGRSFMQRKGDLPASAKEKDLGTLYLKVMFLPFFQPSFDDEDEEDQKAKEKAAKKKATIPTPSQRTVTHNVSDKMKGVLTVHLIRCINLVGSDPNTKVKMLVSDEDHDQVQKSRVVFNENSPRWGDKFDFVMITAGSTLHITVTDKSAGFASSILSTATSIFGKKKNEDSSQVLGKLAIPVKDVVRNGTLKDIFTLADTERGQIELALSWQTCYIAE